jgi:hypothetical protein
LIGASLPQPKTVSPTAPAQVRHGEYHCATASRVAQLVSGPTGLNSQITLCFRDFATFPTGGIGIALDLPVVFNQTLSDTILWQKY